MTPCARCSCSSSKRNNLQLSWVADGLCGVAATALSSQKGFTVQYVGVVVIPLALNQVTQVHKVSIVEKQYWILYPALLQALLSLGEQTHTRRSPPVAFLRGLGSVRTFWDARE